VFPIDAVGGRRGAGFLGSGCCLHGLGV
jgi:hypothetical protein